LTRLPVIVGFGGINPAGRSSGHHGYRRLVYEQLAAGKQQSTLKALAALMQCDADEQSILANTLVRKIHDNLFDPGHYRANKQAMMTGLQNAPLG
jgi:acetoacetyl-[acyl-carrier protein] synthase